MCGCGQPAHDWHHCFIHNIKKRGRSVYPQLNDERNLVFVNHWEHVELRKFDTRHWREYFWRLNCERYGEERMMEWLNSLPEKIKPRMDFVKGIIHDKTARHIDQPTPTHL